MSGTGDAADRERGPDEAYCRNCGEIISERAEICPECGVRQRPPPGSTVDEAVERVLEGGNPVVAALLSAVFPGLGQIYNGDVGRGIAFLLASFVALFSTLAFVGFLLYPVVWVYSIYDAYTRGGGGRRDAAPSRRADAPVEVDAGDESRDRYE